MYSVSPRSRSVVKAGRGGMPNNARANIKPRRAHGGAERGKLLRLHGLASAFVTCKDCHPPPPSALEALRGLGEAEYRYNARYNEMSFSKPAVGLW